MRCRFGSLKSPLVISGWGEGMGCPVSMNSFRHGCLRPFSPVAWGCVSPIDWCPRRSVISHRADAECTLRCLRWVCDALRRMMCPTRGGPLLPTQLVRHAVRSQRGDKSGCRGRYHRCFVAVLLFLTGLIAACGLAASHNLLKHSCGGILLCSRLVVGDFLPRYDE